VKNERFDARQARRRDIALMRQVIVKFTTRENQSSAGTDRFNAGTA
jgi:hypothetical protein